MLRHSETIERNKAYESFSAGLHRRKEIVADIDIIGGSAAGLFAGYLLAREGKRVRLFDANDVLNVDSRTLITTSRLSEALGFFPKEAVVNRIDRIDLYSPRRSVSIPMQEPDLVVERAAVVRLLARKAVDAGVELRGGCKLVELKPSDKSLTVTIRDTHRDRTEEIKTKILIGADGMSSRVAKTAMANGHQTTPLLQAIVELPKGARPGTTQVWFEPADTRYFYWLIPQSETHAAVGFIAEEGKDCEKQTRTISGSRRAESRGDAVRPHTFLHSFQSTVAPDWRLPRSI